MKKMKFDRNNFGHRAAMRKILLACARDEVVWKDLVERVKAHFEVKNWLHVRGILQELKGEGLVKRTDDIFEEVHVLVQDRAESGRTGP